MARHQNRVERERADERARERDRLNASSGSGAEQSNPPRTTRDGITSPKFGSAGSGGAELEPAPGT